MQHLDTFKNIVSEFKPLLAAIPFGALIGFIKFFLGYRVKIKSYDSKNIELLDKLHYDSDEAKKNFVRSSVFTAITKRTTCIHHINLMFNAYDPRRLLTIYSKAPEFVDFSNDDIKKPQKLGQPKFLLGLLIWLMILTPGFYLLLEFSTSDTHNGKLVLLGLVITSFFSAYGIRQWLFFLEVLRYYKDLETNIRT